MKSQGIPRIHLPALDGVRGLAVMLVVLFAHYIQILEGPEPLLRTLVSVSVGVGVTGVDLFFVLSGFLITGILLDTRDGPGYFRNFYARRILRIFPLYYAYLFIEFFAIRGMHQFFEKADRFAAINPYWYLAYLSNLSPNRGVHDWSLNHMWSLAVEEQFYLAWPLLVFLIPRRFLAPFCVAGIVAATLIRFKMGIGYHWEEALHRFTLARMDTLLAGALAAVAFRDERLKALWSRLIPQVAVVSGLGFAAVLAITLKLRPRFSYYYTFGSCATTAFYTCLIFWAATSGSGNPVLCSKMLRVLGKYSYGIYVWHVILFVYIRVGMSTATIGDRLLNIAVNLATTAILAYVSWVSLERPALSLKRFFEYQPSKPGAIAEARESSEGSAGAELVARPELRST